MRWWIAGIALGVVVSVLVAEATSTTFIEHDRSGGVYLGEPPARIVDHPVESTPNVVAGFIASAAVIAALMLLGRARHQSARTNVRSAAALAIVGCLLAGGAVAASAARTRDPAHVGPVRVDPRTIATPGER